METKAELGDRVKDKISGLQGIVVAITDWLYGCERVCIQPEKANKEGKPAENFTCDSPQVEILKKYAIKTTEQAKEEKVEKRPHGLREDCKAQERR